MRIAKNLKWLILVMLLSSVIMAKDLGETYVGSVNVNYSRLNNLNSISVGYNFSHICLDNPALTSSGVSVSTEMYFQNSIRSFGLKATVGISHFIFIEERLSLGAYKELRSEKVWALISPEIGLNLFGFVGIFYGYNYYSAHSIRSKYNSDKFTLSLNIPVYY